MCVCVGGGGRKRGGRRDYRQARNPSQEMYGLSVTSLRKLEANPSITEMS